MEELAREARRLFRRYQLEIVETLNLCPYARRARAEKRVHPRVITAPGKTLSSDHVLAVVTDLAADPQMEIGIVIFPRLGWDLPRFDDFVRELQRRYEDTHPPAERQLGMAAFHPAAEPNLEAPHKLIPFLRRTPDPVIQLVRMAVLDRVRKAGAPDTTYVNPDLLVQLARGLLPESKPAIHDLVAETNLQTIREIGLDAIEARIADIHRDRAETYARLLRS